MKDIWSIEVSKERMCYMIISDDETPNPITGESETLVGDIFDISDALNIISSHNDSTELINKILKMTTTLWNDFFDGNEVNQEEMLAITKYHDILYKQIQKLL
jgi:hypothetical protein